MKNKVEIIEAELAKNGEAQQAIQARISEAITLQTATQQNYDNLRLERQSCLAFNLNITDINSKLKKAQETLDLHFDTVAGLNNELSRLETEHKKLSDNLVIAGKQQFNEELKALALIYNEQASKLAKTVNDIISLRLKMKEDPLSNSAVVQAVPGWRRSALELIPKFYFPGEEVPAVLTEQAFFDATFSWTGGPAYNGG